MRIINDPFNTLYEVIDELYPDLDCDVQYSEELNIDGNTYGVAIFPQDGSKPLIELDPNQSVLDVLEVIAHEVAHVIAGLEADHGEKWEREFTKIHEKFLERMGG